MRFATILTLLASALVASAQRPEDCNNDKNCGGRDCTNNPGGTAGRCTVFGAGGCACTF